MPVDLRPFKRTLIYSRRAPIDAILDDLAALRAFDGKHEKILRLWLTVGVLALLGAVATFFTPRVPLTLGGHDIRPLTQVVTVTLAVFGLGYAAFRSKFNLENRRYELAERVLRFLRRDSRADAEVSVDIDFRSPNVKPKHVRDGKVGPWKVKYYTDRWLRVRGRLLDGTTYRLSAIEKHQHRSKTARGRSGKMKTKSKTKSASELILGLKVKTRRYPQLHRLAEAARGAVQLPEWANLKAYRIHAPEGSDSGTLLLRTATKATWSCAPAGQPEGPTSGVRWFAMSFLSLYQVLNSARAQNKA